MEDGQRRGALVFHVEQTPRPLFHSGDTVTKATSPCFRADSYCDNGDVQRGNRGRVGGESPAREHAIMGGNCSTAVPPPEAATWECT